MVNSQRSTDMLTRYIYWTKSKDQCNDIRDEKQDSVLPDDGVSLGCGRGKLLRGTEEEVDGGGEFGEDMCPKGDGVCRWEQRHFDIVTWCRVGERASRRLVNLV
jgi:hypothetical protein